jgi:hypothetical protein
MDGNGMIELEDAFTKTAKLLLCTELRGLDAHGGWLGRHVPLPHMVKSALSGKDVWAPPPLNYLKRGFNPHRIISMGEMEKVVCSPFAAADLKDAGVADMLAKFIRPVAYHCGDFRYQAHENVEKASGAGGGRNLYYCEDVYHDVRNIAYSNYTLYSGNMFGCHGVSHSSFCIHAYNSTAVNRCFEVDGCSNSRDLLFCHNSEGMSDCMFCFNAKNLRFAIGNVPLAPEQYRQMKSVVLAWIGNELAKTKDLKLDIYNIGGQGGKRGETA